MAREPTYAEQIAQMRAERDQRVAVERVAEIEREYAAAVQERDRAAGSEDIDTFEVYDEEARRLEREYAQYVPPPQAPPLSDQTQNWIARRGDLRGRPNQLHPHLTNDQVAVYLDQYARMKGLQEGSPEYLEILTRGTDPSSYEPMPDADDIVSTLRKTSKYGKDLSPKTYNKGVERLQREKAKGGYPDR